MTNLGPLKGFLDFALGGSSEPKQAVSKFSDQQIRDMKEEAIQTEMKVNGLSRKDAETKVEHLF